MVIAAVVCHSGSRGVNLSRLSLGVEINEPTTSKWTSGTSVKFEHIRPVNNDGRSIARDHEGFPLTCSGNLHDNMIILKQESGYADVKDNSFLRVNFQMEQGLPLVPKSLTFNRVKCAVSKGIKLGPTFLVTSLTGGSIVGDMAPYQAFAIGGLGSVRGYGEGAVGSGRLCLIGNCEYTVPLVVSACKRNIPYTAKDCDEEFIVKGYSFRVESSEAKNLEGSLFMDCGSDLGSARHVPGNPALRQGKPGFGVGFGYGVHFNTDIGQIRVDYAMNAFSRKTFYFSINTGGAGS
ncbi:outer envelope protein 39, chloroplastic isoform X5 [Aegilops tauschii subsp. strangulata]|uniref:outer envelope protein 39, chloroplastic isoform X5 n=1 Tax=Aegilops tauschii subsp. strangulata TaxID=200361 RepID=UPI001ABD02E1|nr:outer envelope protein 39, chloroplastic isoform X4 [Aegilops tauschii subsp. strangulata]XP_040245149.1 outer envelope protein 39, chloroplastic isoform X4 [Aegilops tauschii subsp. strangulata]